MPKQITVRGVSAELSKRIVAVARERGESVNATVLHLLEDALGLDESKRRLLRYATWSEDEVREFNETLRAMRTVDPEAWK